MLELPESVTVAKQITEKLTGETILEIEVLKSPHRFAFFKGDRKRYGQMLEGQVIESATNRGGLVEIDTTDYMMFFGDGAYPRYFESSEKAPKKRQFMLTLKSGAVIAVAIQMYGEIGVFKKGECKEPYYISSSTKPSPLTDAFTYEYFKSLYTEETRLSVKAFLATEQRIPGLGNGILQDILWNAGIDPRFDMRKLDEEGFRSLYQAVISTIKTMCEQGGRDTEKLFFGMPGGYVTQLSKNSLHEPCMRCGNEIHKANYMGGTIYFCEHCQKR